MIAMTPLSFANHSEITITPLTGSGSGSGCELTEDKCYTPNTATVEVAGVVIFSNTDDVKHTFTSGVPTNDSVGTEFNSGILLPGDSAKWIPKTVGEFSYFDMIHPWMQGLIIVIEEKEDHETHERNADGTFVEEGQNETVVEETVVEEHSCRRNSCRRNSCRRNSCRRNSCRRNSCRRNSCRRNSCRRNSNSCCYSRI